jgi:hypothetical protein
MREGEGEFTTMRYAATSFVAALARECDPAAGNTIGPAPVGQRMLAPLAKCDMVVNEKRLGLAKD